MPKRAGNAKVTIQGIRVVGMKNDSCRLAVVYTGVFLRTLNLRIPNLHRLGLRCLRLRIPLPLRLPLRHSPPPHRFLNGIPPHPPLRCFLHRHHLYLQQPPSAA